MKAPDLISVWESQRDMEFNPSKCQVVRVTARKAINSVYILHGPAARPDSGSCHES